MSISNCEPFWYWEYIIDYYNEIDNETQKRSGVIAAENMNEAIQSLIDFYGESAIENILTLKIILEGNVLEFNEVNKNQDIDFTVTKR